MKKRMIIEKNDNLGMPISLFTNDNYIFFWKFFFERWIQCKDKWIHFTCELLD